MNDAGGRIAAFFESMRREDLARLHEVYEEGASFKDPFNEVRGIAAIARVYAHMFDQLEAPRFTVTSRVLQGNDCWLAWDFHFASPAFGRGQPQAVKGASHLVLGPGGRIRAHRDYWDAAEELYEKLPVLGALLRMLKRRMAA